VVLPELAPDDVDELLARLDGVVLVGGPDVGPSSYGEEAVAATVAATPSRDAFDLALARRCVERGVPLLAICRGIQVLNVAMGGSLVQDVPDHMQMDRWNDDVHALDFEPTSSWRALAGRHGVNSLHHQAIDRFGDGVRAVARADDGTIEAIEVDDAGHVLGVQWHPELLRHRPEHLALFTRLVDLAGGG
jgi:putative glutamine amidotransferase